MTTSKPGWSPIHEAGFAEDLAQVDALIAEGADVNAKSPGMLSSLATSRVVRPKGATFHTSVNPTLSRPGFAFDKDATPLHVAAAVGSVPILTALQRAKAKPTAVDGVGASALHHAALHGHAEALAWLLKTKQKVDAAIRVRKSVAFYDKGMTALHAALESGDLDAVTVLLEAGASVHAVTDYGCGALFFAARGGNAQTLSVLEQAGIALDATGSYLNDPLMEAIERGHHEFVERLSKAGARSPHALWTATKRGDERMRQVLLDAGAAPLQHRGLADAAGTNDIDAVKTLLASGADVNDALDGVTGLMRACRDGHADVVELLLAAGARVDAEGKRAGPLHLALEAQRPDIALRLIEAGADLDALDERGNTPLFVAVMKRGTDRCIAAMIERGANPYQRMRHGNWAMKVAHSGSPERVALLEKTRHRDDPSAVGWAPPDVENTTLTFTSGASSSALLDELFEKLVPPSGEANSVQGELVRASTKLFNEAMRNANGNFDGFFRDLGHFLERLLTEPFTETEQASLRRDIQALTRGTLEGDTHRRVAEAVVRWCQAHPKLVALPPR